MTEDEIREILQRKDRWIALTTLGPDGFPHTVPLGYFLSGNRIVMGCKDETQKVRNVERNSKVSLLWENGRGANELTAIMIRGNARIVRDDKERLELKIEACRQRGEEFPSSVAAGFVYIEVSPTRTVSWRRSTGRSS